jgi:hypothetical protein
MARAFRLTEGGPCYRVLAYLRLRTPTGVARMWWLGVAIWLPLGLGELVHFLLGIPGDPALRDISLHIRILFTLPILLIAERLLDQTVLSALASFDRGGYTDREATDAILARAEKLRDAWQVELALLAVALVGGQLVLWRVFGSAGLFHGGADVGALTFSRVWYGVVALPLVQFVMFRWMWRWVIWTFVLYRISRLPLSVVATHADFAGGLAVFARPVTGFAGFVLGNGAIIAAAWGTQAYEGASSIQRLMPMLVVYLLTVAVLAVGPLFVFCAPLFRARRLTLAQYGDFMRTYTLQFHSKWIAPVGQGSPLGTPDIQSLADLGHAFQVASKTRVFAFGPRTLVVVWIAALIPMVPLFAGAISFETVLKRIVGTVLGGLPM